MKIKEIFQRVLFYISVPKCVLCKEKLDLEDRGLCKSCMMKYEQHKERNCPYCSKKLQECFCSYKDLKNHGIKNLAKVFRYSKAEQSMPSNYLIYSLKQDNRSDVLSLLSDELSKAILNSLDISASDYIVTNVPRRKDAIVKFGYDHSEALARSVAKSLGVEYVRILKSKSKKAQKSVYGRIERVRNARFDYKCPENLSLKGKTVILIDDIITTGASLCNSATLIRALRPKRIVAACLGTAYKDRYIDFKHSQ